MTDYTAHDIHLIDQGAVDALRAVDALAADPETARRLAERGEAVYGAELTADLHNTVDGRAMSLAGWAAFATIRLVQARARHSTDHDEAARMWAEDVDMVWAKVAERDAELEKLTAELAELRKQVCLIVTCSDCGKKFEYDGAIWHFKNLDEAKDVLHDEGWRFVDGKPMCGDCLPKDHPFAPDEPPMEWSCVRCGLEEDDHEPATEKAEVAR